jgi:hypothetical protein
MSADNSLILEAKIDIINTALQVTVLLIFIVLVANFFQGIDSIFAIKIAKYFTLGALSVFTMYLFRIIIRIESIVREAISIRRQKSNTEPSKEESKSDVIPTPTPLDPHLGTQEGSATRE